MCWEVGSRGGKIRVFTADVLPKKKLRGKQLDGGVRGDSSCSPILPNLLEPSLCADVLAKVVGNPSDLRLPDRVRTLTDVIKICFEECKIKIWTSQPVKGLFSCLVPWGRGVTLQGSRQRGFETPRIRKVGILK